MKNQDKDTLGQYSHSTPNKCCELIVSKIYLWVPTPAQAGIQVLHIRLDRQIEVLEIDRQNENQADSETDMLIDLNDRQIKQVNAYKDYSVLYRMLSCQFINVRMKNQEFSTLRLGAFNIQRNPQRNVFNSFCNMHGSPHL